MIRKGVLAMNVIRSVVRYFLDILEVRDYGDKLIIEIKGGKDANSRRNTKSNNQ